MLAICEPKRLGKFEERHGGWCIIHKGYVVYMGERNYPVADKINVIGAESFLKINT